MICVIPAQSPVKFHTETMACFLNKDKTQTQPVFVKWVVVKIILILLYQSGTEVDLQVEDMMSPVRYGCLPCGYINLCACVCFQRLTVITHQEIQLYPSRFFFKFFTSILQTG